MKASELFAMAALILLVFALVEMTSKYLTSGSYGRINVGDNEIGG